MMRWSPTSKVFFMDSEGITRAWPTAALIRRKIRMTQVHAMTSRRTFCCGVRFSSGLRCFGCLAFMRHRDWAVGLNWRGIFDAGIFEELAVRAAFANLKLHEIGWINTRITRRTEVALGVADGLFQAVERDVAERIG